MPDSDDSVVGPTESTAVGATSGENNDFSDDSDAPVPMSTAATTDEVTIPATPRNKRRQSQPRTPLTPSSVVGGERIDNDGDAVDSSDNEAVAAEQQQQPASNDNNTTTTEAHIRGTDVHVPTAAASFTDFIQSFISLEHAAKKNKKEKRKNRGDDSDDDKSCSDSESDDNDDSMGENTAPIPMYKNKLIELLNTGNVNVETSSTASITIDAIHLYFHSSACQKLYHQLIQYPMEMVPLFDIVVQRELQTLYYQQNEEDLADDEEANIPRVQVRPYNLKTVSNLRELDPISMDTLVCCKGMIVRSSPIIPDLKVAHFSCTVCGHVETSTIDRGRITEPSTTGRCPGCQVAGTFSLFHNRCVYADKQLVRLQETPDEVPAGQTPASVVTFAYDDLVDAMQPGDRVEVTGVLRAQPVRVNPKISKVKTVYKTYLDVIHFRKITGMESNKSETGVSEHQGQFSPARIAELRALSKDPNIYQKLTDSLAPSIWELENCKRGILCMLFGGNHLRVKKGSHKTNATQRGEGDSADEDDNNEDEVAVKTTKLNKRGDINILLCGDPGTSKSQLLSYVNKLSARGVYTSGKGSSAVGLTASVVRDPETRDLVLESGALVLSDRGICCIDEFDKMSDLVRSVLHEAMEQQTVSIAKAGIIATLHARTSVLASANPTESRYNPNRSVVDNIQLPPTLLSRFDLIYLILDNPNVEYDRRLAQHLVGLYYETPNVVQPPLDQSLLRDYIEYARQNIHPEISDEASEQLIESYLEMRNPTGSAGGGAAAGTRTISATARQLESLIRLSEALAKMRYGTIVTRGDAREAVRLMRVATQAAATDPRTGRIDMDMIATGRSANDREQEAQLDMSMKELLRERRGTRMSVRDIVNQVNEISNTSVSNDTVLESLRRMHADNIIQLNERKQTLFVRSEGIVH